MYKRFWIICAVMGAALLVLSALGVSSLNLQERSLRAERQGQFAAVAEQIRVDIKTRLDDFLQTEQRRPYTDYQYAYVPETTNQAEALIRSPLADSLTNGLAFGYFQINPDGSILTPYAQPDQPRQSLDPVLAEYLTTLGTNVLNSLNGQGHVRLSRIPPRASGQQLNEDASESAPMQSLEPVQEQQTRPAQKQIAPRASQRAQTYPVESIADNTQPQMMQQSRAAFERNIAIVKEEPQADLPNAAPVMDGGMMGGMRKEKKPAKEEEKSVDRRDSYDFSSTGKDTSSLWLDGFSASTVQIRVEPFAPLVVRDGTDIETVFGGQIYLLRHVQIEDVHLIQGFRLNETELARQVQDSADRLLREGMAAKLIQSENPEAAHAAILDFGFGELVLNLFERDPDWIAAQVTRLNLWMTAILGVVWLAVLLAMFALWRNLHDQIRLARKKDDFISAVSHELRTPLTSIRMYTEMLEKDWVRDEAKRREYYGTMRQESERLSRLIENVLDFSRLQRGKKRFDFRVGDVNSCIHEVLEAMRPYAERAGFEIETKFSSIEPFAFDRDAMMQIIINLIDNALKYAKDSDDKRIIIRTYPDEGSVVIEVEDRGPGIPKSQRKKIFEAFYRCGDEATRQAVGTGLGLALVKRFTEAHRGVVEILNAQPVGALFRIRFVR